MAFLRRSLVLCVVLAGAAVLAGPTLAAAGPRGADLLCLGYPSQLGSPHFLVHYMSDNTPLSCDVKKAITETQAGDILGYAEDAYAAEIGTYGFPAPPSDGVVGGYSRWPFWQSVTQLYGHGFVKEVFLHGAANPGETGVAALQGALAAHGATLADTFINWTVQQMAGTYGLTVLDQMKPKIWGAAIKTGTTSATLPAIQVPVNHLATRLVEFDRGDGSGASACFAATLSLTVTMPAGIA